MHTQLKFPTEQAYLDFISRFNNLENLEKVNEKLLTQIAELQIKYPEDIKNLQVDEKLLENLKTQLKESLTREESYKKELLSLKEMNSWEQSFVENVYNTIFQVCNDGVRVIDSIAPAIENYLQDVKSQNKFLHPKQFLTKVLYQELVTKFGQTGLQIYQYVVKSSNSFLINPYETEDYFDPMAFLNKQFREQKQNSEYFDILQFLQQINQQPQKN